MNQHYDIDTLEEILRKRVGREPLDAELSALRVSINRMFDSAKRRLGLHNIERDEGDT